MPIQLQEKDGGKVLVVHVSGKLLKEDYAVFVPAFDRLFASHGRLRVLFDLTGFDGWEASAAWADAKFAAKHFSDIERLAVVGDNKWEHGLATFCRPFTRATVQYFEQADAARALAWLEEV